MAAYVTIQEAQAYFDDKLHETAWTLASAADQRKSLIAATKIINTLRYKGYKNVVYAYLLANPDTATDADEGDSDALAAIREVEATQENEFPRGADTETPEVIQWACCEIAYALLDGVDPELELENIGIQDMGIGSVRSSFSRAHDPLEHLIAGVPSPTAWKWLKPFLRDNDQIRIMRIS